MPDRGHAQRREFAFAARKVDRIRVDGGDGTRHVHVEAERLDAEGGRRSRAGRRRGIDGVEILKTKARGRQVADLSATDIFQVAADADAHHAPYGSEDDDQISLGSFGVLGPTFVQLARPVAQRHLTIDGRGGDDISARRTPRST